MQRLARIKQSTIDLYKRRKLARFNWWFIYLAANLLRKAWKAQWSLVFKTEAARQLAIAQQEMSLHIQRKWRDRVAFRYARLLRFVVVAHLQDMQSIGSKVAGCSAEAFFCFIRMCVVYWGVSTFVARLRSIVVLCAELITGRVCAPIVLRCWRCMQSCGRKPLQSKPRNWWGKCF
jgi:hypothetical protein